MHNNVFRGSAAFVVAFWATAGAASDLSGWAQFRGPQRDGISTETGLIDSWGEAGPAEVWRVPIGVGFSGMAIVDGHLYTMDAHDDVEYAASYDAATGRELWRVEVGELFTNEFGNGPRATPATDEKHVFVLGSRGRLLALDRETGQASWELDFLSEFGGELPRWAFSASPLLVGDLLIVESGGAGEQAVAAVDKDSGEIRWTAREDLIAYSSPIQVEFNGVQQIVFLTRTGLFATDHAGNILWTSEFYPDLGISPAPPVFVPPDLIFASASYDRGAKVVRLLAQGDTVAVEDVWQGPYMRNHFNASIRVDDHICGFDKANLKCIEAATGEQTWVKRGLGKGSLIAADGKLIVLSERGKLVLLEADPRTYSELASHQVLEGRSWTQPALAGGRLFLRNHSQMVCLDLRADGRAGGEEVTR